MVGPLGFEPPYTLSGPTTTNKTFFMCVFPKFSIKIKMLIEHLHNTRVRFIIFKLFVVYMYIHWKTGRIHETGCKLSMLHVQSLMSISKLSIEMV